MGKTTTDNGLPNTENTDINNTAIVPSSKKKQYLFNNTNGTIEVELGLKDLEILIIPPFKSTEATKEILQNKRIKNLIEINSLYTKEVQ